MISDSKATSGNLKMTLILEALENFPPLARSKNSSHGISSGFWRQKASALNELDVVKKAQQERPWLAPYLESGDQEQQVIILSLLLIEVAGFSTLLFDPKQFRSGDRRLLAFLEKMKKVERAYLERGGIVGYQAQFMKLLGAEKKVQEGTFSKPLGTDLSIWSDEIEPFVEGALENWDQVAFVIPLGGAGDRLNLIDENTAEALPAAFLNFEGVSLLEGILRDAAAIEKKVFEKTKKRVQTPFVIMTSLEKDNDARVRRFFEEHHYFGRGRDRFFFITQVSFPVLDKEGRWASHAPYDPVLKPGGHGAIWKLAQDEGALQWLEEQGCEKLVVRQINNPCASLDWGLLAFVGVGLVKDKQMGFASCQRLIGANEGMNILVEKPSERGRKYSISNIEYTDFEKQGVEDGPEEKGSIYSKFPSNTNLLFLDISALKEAIEKEPYPGPLINFKNKAPFLEGDELSYAPAGRIETTMQNIADVIETELERSLEDPDQLKQYITYNRREKTISAVKKGYHEGSCALETPEGAFYDRQQVFYEMLACVAKQLPSRKDFMDFSKRPPFLFFFHPAQGPLFKEISARYHHLVLEEGAYLDLEISDFKSRELVVEGCLQIYAKEPLGSARVRLESVTVKNRGVDYLESRPFWRKKPSLNEALKVTLGKNASFEAVGVCLYGELEFEVPADSKMLICAKGGDPNAWQVKVSSQDS